MISSGSILIVGMSCHFVEGLFTDCFLLLMASSIVFWKSEKRYQTPTSLECLAEDGAHGKGLRLGVDDAESRFAIIRPEWDEPPSHHGKLPFAAVPVEPNHRLKCLGSHVI